MFEFKAWQYADSAAKFKLTLSCVDWSSSSHPMWLCQNPSYGVCGSFSVSQCWWWYLCELTHSTGSPCSSFNRLNQLSTLHIFQNESGQIDRSVLVHLQNILHKIYKAGLTILDHYLHPNIRQWGEKYSLLNATCKITKKPTMITWHRTSLPQQLLLCYLTHEVYSVNAHPKCKPSCLVTALLCLTS